MGNGLIFRIGLDKVGQRFFYIEIKKGGSKLSAAYPIPLNSGGTLTIEFDVKDARSYSAKLKSCL